MYFESSDLNNHTAGTLHNSLQHERGSQVDSLRTSVVDCPPGMDDRVATVVISQVTGLDDGQLRPSERGPVRAREHD